MPLPQLSFLKRPHTVFFTGLAIVLAYVAPYFIYGRDLPITLLDNLDSNLVWMKLLLSGGYFTDWSRTEIAPLMNGVPVKSLAPIYDISALLMSLFGMFWGYVVTKTLMALAGFTGMWVLLRRYLIPGEPAWIAGGVAVAYGILPYWGFTFSTAMLPFMFAAFLAFRQNGFKAGVAPWLALIFAAFSTSLILVGVFFIAFCGLWALYDTVMHRRKNGASYVALAVLSVFYVVSHIRLFLGFLSDSQVSHRSVIDFTFRFDGLLFKRFATLFTKGWYHDASVQTLFIPLVLLAMVFAYKKPRTGIRLINVMEFLILSSFWYGLVNWQSFQWFIKPVTSIVPIQLGRLHFLQPVAWYVALALAVVLLIRAGRWGKIVSGLVIAAQLIFLFTLFETRDEEEYTPSYRAFYSTQLFDNIKSQLGDPSEYRVISVGMHPAIALYNGFYTLDGYCPDYPLAYKHQFRELIAGELDRSPILTRYYDEWGSRAYAFSAEIGKEYIFPKGNPVELQGLAYNWGQFKKMGGQYIFAAFPIADPALETVGVFNNSESAWQIFVYRVKRGVSSE